eukprot:TRINITY_DN9359_c0_g1_i6.p1 TRINITY_DN9359_c0_g1~~TRINITY_DN9359_c0_g1_i6.p1  ORF type:complete len:264 (+),score=49.07 TRINITY_DN9359_c0_g1_i6:435-1226(+)
MGPAPGTIVYGDFVGSDVLYVKVVHGGIALYLPFQNLKKGDILLKVKTTHVPDWDCQFNDREFVARTAAVRRQGRYDLRQDRFYERIGMPKTALKIDFEVVGCALEQIELAGGAVQKLEALLEVKSQIIEQCTIAEMKHIGADELVPVLVVSLIWSPLVCPSSDVAFMQDELQEALEHGEGGYMFACFAAAVDFIINELDASEFYDAEGAGTVDDSAQAEVKVDQGADVTKTDNVHAENHDGLPAPPRNVTESFHVLPPVYPG